MSKICIRIIVIFCAVFAVSSCVSVKESKEAKAGERAFSKRFDDPMLNLVIYNAWSHYHEGRFDHAYNDCDRLAAKGYAHYDVLFCSGVSSFMMNDYSRAISLLSRCIKEEPQHAEALYYRSRAYWNVRDISRARADYVLLQKINTSKIILCGAHFDDRIDSATNAKRISELSLILGEDK